MYLESFVESDQIPSEPDFEDHPQRMWKPGDQYWNRLEMCLMQQIK